MPDSLHLTATLEPRGPAGAIVLTDEQVASLGAGTKAFPVKVTVNGTTLSLRLARMGGENLIGFSKAARGDAGVEIGESYAVDVELDAGDRVVEVPDDVTEALRSGGVDARFEALAYSHRKEFVRWITEAKKPETRTRRIEQALQMIRDGRAR